MTEAAWSGRCRDAQSAARAKNSVRSRSAAGEQVAEFGDGQFDHRAVALIGVDGEPDGVADALRDRRHGVVAEAEQVAALDEPVPVAPVLQSVAAAGLEADSCGGVGDAQAACREEVVEGQQPVQERVDRVARTGRAVAVGVDVIAAA